MEVRDLAVSSPKLPEDPRRIVYSTATDGEWCLIYGGEGVPPELYHLPSDPRQERDLSGERRDVVESLHAQYCELLERIGTPEGRLRLRNRLP